MSKQDRQGVRTTQGLEQKYSFGKVFTQQQRENARQNSEMNQQNLTMKQFISFASSAIDTLQKGLATAEGLISALQKAVSKLDGRMNTAEGNISNSQKAISGLDTRIGNAEKTITKDGKRLTTAEEKISRHHSMLATMEEDFVKLAERVTALEKL